MLRKTTILLLALLATPFTSAETIKLKLGEQGQQEQIQLPQRGLTMEEVLAQFGEPESKTEARGEPPISTWHFPEFAVYFESQHVIHSVKKHQPTTDKQAE